MYLFFFASISLTGQVMNRQEIEKGTSIKRNALYNLEEIKVRWKKAALENCPGVPCVTSTVPGAPTNVVATTGNTTASVAFTAPTNNGGSVITGYTVRSNPGNITATGSTSPITVTGLTNGTAYTFTVVATNAVGNSVASAASTSVTPGPPPFTCGTSTVSDIDGNAYNTVLIGNQCWMASNLKVTKYNDGTSIPLDASGTSTGLVGETWSARNEGAYTIYENEPSTGPNATNYGFLYNWYAAKGIATTGSTTYKNICPTGYHVPTDSDWNKLVKFIHSGTPAADTSSTSSTQSATAGAKLKKNDALWTQNTGTNTSDFSALPGGRRNSAGTFFNIRNNAFFWSATEYDVNFAWYRSLSNFGGVSRGSDYDKSVGASVRCLRDSSITID